MFKIYCSKITFDNWTFISKWENYFAFFSYVKHCYKFGIWLLISSPAKNNKSYLSSVIFYPNLEISYTHPLTRALPMGAGRSTFFISDIKLQAIYKVIHTSNYDGHISKYVCKIGKYNQKCVSQKLFWVWCGVGGIIFSCNTILVHMK